MTRYRDLPAPLVVAHRGGAGLAPENSVAAFAGALHLGVTAAWDGRLAAVRAQTGSNLPSTLGWRAAAVLMACARTGLGVPRSLAGDASFVHLPLRVGRRDLLADGVAGVSAAP